MVELKLTKTKLMDYFRVFRLVLGICDKFIITNDIIQPLEITDEIVTGAHRVRHPLFSVTAGHVFKSVDNLGIILNEIRDRKGAKNITLINNDDMLFVRIDYEEYILATSSETTDSTTTFDEIISKYILSKSHYHYSKNLLVRARLGEVITVGDDTFGAVRLSKSSFPFMGVARVNDEINFSGSFSLGQYDNKLSENYIASYIQYKYCDAFHMYVYVPFDI